MNNPVHEQMLKRFAIGGLEGKKATLAGQFLWLAESLANDESLDGRETTVALRKLLESRDCVMRATEN